MNEYTPKDISRLRMKIIGAMLDGEISSQVALRLQEIRGNIGLVMACKRYGIELEDKQPPEAA